MNVGAARGDAKISANILVWCLCRAPRDGASVDEEDVADRRQAGVWDVGEGSVGVAVDDA